MADQDKIPIWVWIVLGVLIVIIVVVIIYAIAETSRAKKCAANLSFYSKGDPYTIGTYRP